MAIYSYIGINDKGKKVSGAVDAENEKAARLKLRKDSIFPTSLTIGGGSAKLGLGSLRMDISKLFQRIKLQDVALMTRQLSTLLAANIPLVDALQAVYEQLTNEKLKGVIAEMRQKVVEGSKLSDAMRTYSNIFGDMYVNMVNAGENSGALDVVLTRLADFTENQNRIRGKLVGAMIYPIIMGVVGVALMGFLMVFMVPKMTKIFIEQKMALPLPTTILIFISDTIANYWYLLLLAVGVIYYFVRKWFKTPKGAEYRDRKLLKLPLFGELVRMVAISRFSRTLSTLLASGVPMLASMDIVKMVVGNIIIRKAVEVTRDSVKEGESIAEPLKRSGEFPPIVTHMVAIGEKTGELEKMLERISDTYDNQVDTAVSAMLSIMEPVLILTLAGGIAFVVVALLLPILEMGDLGAAG